MSPLKHIIKGRTHSLPEGSADPLFTRKIIQNMLSAPKYFENMLNNIFDQEQ